MIAEVVGKDKTRRGTSKAGNPYEVTTLHCVSTEEEHSQYFDGYKVEAVGCFFDVSHVKVGDTVRLVYENGFRGQARLVAVEVVEDSK